MLVGIFLVCSVFLLSPEAGSFHKHKYSCKNIMLFILEYFADFKSMGIEKKMQKQCTTPFQWASNSFQAQVSQITSKSIARG